MKSHRPIFISIETLPYSGATLLSFLLGVHPCVATVGEMDGLITHQSSDEYLCSCGSKIINCEFWEMIKSSMADRGFEFDTANFNTRFILNGPNFVQRLRAGSFGNRIELIRDAVLFNMPSETRQLKSLADRNVALVESILEATNKNVFLDSSKDRLRLKALRRFTTSFDLRAIHLVRDVRGAVASNIRHGSSKEVNKIAYKWVKQHRGIEMSLKSWPKEKYIRVRYEDLCQNVEGTLKWLYEFCGVDSNFKVENFRATSHHIIGNQMRLRPISEIKLDERWKNELTTDQLKKIDQIAGTLRHRYGYA